MNKIFVISRETGSYSGYQMTPIFYAADEEIAKKFVEIADAEKRRLQDIEQKECEKYRRAVNALPGKKDYFGLKEGQTALSTALREECKKHFSFIDPEITAENIDYALFYRYDEVAEFKPQ